MTDTSGYRDPIGRTSQELDAEYQRIGQALAGTPAPAQRPATPRRVTTRPATTRPAASTPAAGGRQVSGNLSGGLSGLGITVDPTAGGYIDTTDLPVYVGTHDSKGRKKRADPVVRSSYAYIAPYRWDPKDLEKFQQRMFDAGLLGSNRDAIAWGTVDGLTERAWRSLVDTAANYWQAGKKIRPQDVLDQIGVTAAGDGGRAPLTVELDNPATIKRLMREAAREATGSGSIDDAKLDEIVARWHGEQRRAQTAAYGAADSGGTVTQPVDFETFADTELRRVDPAGYDAYQVLDKFSTMLDTLGGNGALTA